MFKLLTKSIPTALMDKAMWAGIGFSCVIFKRVLASSLVVRTSSASVRAQSSRNTFASLTFPPGPTGDVGAEEVGMLGGGVGDSNELAPHFLALVQLLPGGSGI